MPDAIENMPIDLDVQAILQPMAERVGQLEVELAYARATSDAYAKAYTETFKELEKLQQIVERQTASAEDA